MPKAAEKLFGIVEPIAKEHGAVFNSFSSGKFRDIGKLIDSGSLTIAQALPKIRALCWDRGAWKGDNSRYEKEDLKTIEKNLEKAIR